MAEPFSTGRWRGMVPVGACVLAAVLVSMLAGCGPAAPELSPLSPQDAYLQHRRAAVDARHPCVMSPFPAFPIKLVGHRIFIPVAVNGVQSVGILDTGATFSLITPELAAAAGIAAGKPGDKVLGVAGSFAPKVGMVDAVQFGSVKSFALGQVHIYPFGGSQGTVVGVQVGIDWLGGLDYDMDVRHERITPYRVQNCATIDPPWHDDYAGVIAKRDFEIRGDHHSFLDAIFNRQLTLPVIFPNGHAIEAEFDTGSTDSLLSHDAALDAGLTGSQIRADPVAISIALDGRRKELHRHIFETLSLGEEELHNFGAYIEPHYDRRAPPMLLGMDYIALHRFWISFVTGAIYIDSGKMRQPVAPFDEPRQVSGATMPEHPAETYGRKGSVQAVCMVEADGSLSDCYATLRDGPEAYRTSVLSWLASPYGPIMQPAYRDGVPIARTYRWDLNFPGK